MAVTSVFNCSGINKKKFLNYTEKNKKTFEIIASERNWATEYPEKNVVIFKKSS